MQPLTFFASLGSLVLGGFAAYSNRLDVAAVFAATGFISLVIFFAMDCLE